MNRTAFVTGSASGIGRHLTSALVRRGYSVFATDVDADKLAIAARDEKWPEAQVSYETLDVRDAEAWQRALLAAIARFSEVDLLFNVAGVLRPGFVQDTRASDVDMHFDVNVKGVVHGTRVFSKYFVARRAGHVVNVGSLASLAPVPGLSLYSASKFAVRGFTLAAAQELSPHGVKVSLLMPDAVETPMLELQVDYPEAAMTFSGSRALTVEDIERAIFDEVLPKAPLEVAIPGTRGFLARMATFAPATTSRLGPLFVKAGKSAQAARRAKR